MIYNQELRDLTYKEFVLRNNLYNAIENNEFQLYYQPKFDRNKKLVGTEALIRWNNPELGLVTPTDFIPIAEETELIIPIGEWVIKEACIQGKKWQDAGYSPIKISINLSPVQLYQKNISSRIKALVDEIGYETKWLEIEVTENSIRDNKIIATVLSELRDYGFSIAIDDFGTGYSSFEALKLYSFNTIKIDKSFISDLSYNKISRDIVASMINLAKSLKASVVAEGVENEEQFELLRDLNCEEYQGYLFSKPVPNEIFEEILKRQELLNYNYSEKRKYYRINFTYTLEADLEILEANNKKIESGKTSILIEDISAGGLRFISNIKFPIGENITFGIKTILLGENLELYGRLVWENDEKDCYRYGLEFKIDDYKREHLIQLLNKVQIQL